MGFFERGLQNIADNDGYSLSIAGMGIVFSALLFIAIIIKLLPYFLKILDKIIPEKIVEPKVQVKGSGDKSAVIAAIAGAIFKKNKNVE